jgi:PAS domain S-box-containing protein
VERDASLPSEAAPGQLSGESNGRLHDLLIAVKDIHHALLVAENEAELFQQICNSLKHVSYVKFAWIGLAEKGTFDIKPVAFAGFEDGYLSSIKVAWDDSEYGKGPAGMAIKTGQPYVMRDIATDPRYDPWRKEALKRGYASSIALPLIHEGEVIGSLNLYSERKDAFGDQEAQFLNTVAEDVALGIRSLRLQMNLQESEAKYRTLVEQSLQGIVIAQGPPPPRLVFANPTMAKILGYTPDELTALSPKETEGLVHPEDRAVFFGRFSDRLQGKPAPPRYEVRGIRKDGEVRWLDFSSNRIEYQGQPAVQAAFVDITERKRMEDALRESQARLRDAQALGLIGSWEFDVESGRIAWSGQTYKLYERDPALGPPTAEEEATYYSPEQALRLREYARRAIAEGADFRYDLEADLPSGRHVFYSAMMHPIKDAHGRVVKLFGTVQDITERKRAEEVLRESEERFRQAMEATSDGLWDWNVETGEVYFSPAYYQMLGYEPDELPGLAQTWMELIHPDERDEVLRSNQGCIENRIPNFQVEFRMRTRSGGWKWILGRGRASTRDANGRALRMIGTHEDITERKKMEEELRSYSTQLEQLVAERTRELAASKDFAENLIQTANAIVVGLDNHGNVRFFNQAAERITGYTGKELEGRNWFEVIAPKDRYPEVWREFERLKTAGLRRNFENPILTKSGEERYVVWQNSEVREQGQVVGTISFGIDITERKRAEEELRATRERLEYVIGSNPAVIYAGKPLADRSDFIVTYLSDRVVSMLGFEPREFIGHPEFWQRRVHSEDVRSVLAEMPRLWKEGQYSFDYRFLHKDGAYRWIREEAKVVRDADGKPIEVNGYWTDITERKHLEEALAKSQRLAAIGETSAMVGHDLRNPLQGIAGVVYLAKKNLESRKTTDRKAVTELLDTIQEQITYMDKIVSDLQDYAQPLVPKLTETDLPNLIRQTLSTVRIPKAVKVSVEVEKAAQNVMIDPTLMRRTFANLAMNAIQAMPKRGKLTVRARSKGNSTVMTVEDTGEGIAKKNLTKLFSPFFTTKAKGQGLGLAVCKRLVEAQGGAITVKSKPRKGTVFTIKMPRGRKEVAS